MVTTSLVHGLIPNEKEEHGKEDARQQICLIKILSVFNVKVFPTEK